MNGQTLKRRLFLLAGAILLLGLGSSLALYLTAEETLTSDLVADYEHSKVYRRSLEVNGGKLSVVADELSRWFAGLWQGKNLALTVGVLSVVLAVLLFFVASRWHDVPRDESA
jgi:hypothetical protein